MKRKLCSIKWEVLITVIISLTSVFVAIKANAIYNMQAEIARNSALPTIEVNEKIEEDNQIGWGEYNVIEISNLSGKLDNYQSEIITFMHCGYFENRIDDYYKEIDIPIENYYIFEIKKGNINGLVEEKSTAGNYVKVKKLMEDIRNYNKKNEKGQQVNAILYSYLKISYLDFFNEEQVLYYKIDPIDVEMVDSDFGKSQFDKYKTAYEQNFYINPNQDSIVSVNEVINCIEGILNLEDINLENWNTNSKETSRMISGEMIATIIGALIGFIGSIIVSAVVHWQEKKDKMSFAASILYNDLKSIERYLTQERGPVNLRYSDAWQQMVSNCSFLCNDEVEYVYSIYDEVYNYNYQYILKEQKGAVIKEEISSYKNLQDKIFDTSKGYPDFQKSSETYKKLIECLHAYMK